MNSTKNNEDLLTADRTSSEVAAHYEPLHPAVLHTLHRIGKTAAEHTKDASICGEMAGNPAFTELLLGLGFKSLSVNPSEILEIKNAIRGTKMQEAESFARQILALSTSQEIKVCMRERNMYRKTQMDIVHPASTICRDVDGADRDAIGALDE